MAGGGGWKGRGGIAQVRVVGGAGQPGGGEGEPPVGRGTLSRDLQLPAPLPPLAHTAIHSDSSGPYYPLIVRIVCDSIVICPHGVLHHVVNGRGRADDRHPV